MDCNTNGIPDDCDLADGTSLSFMEQLEAAEQTEQTRWHGSFKEFLRLFETDEYPSIGHLAHQRIESMIVTAGTETQDYFGRARTQYKFFEDSLYGIESSIDQVMSYVHAAARKTETARRMLLLYGPPSSGKSDLVVRIKRGLEAFSRQHDGAVFALKDSEMHESPFMLIPNELRADFKKQYGVKIEGQLSPHTAWRLQHDFGGKFLTYPVEQVFISESQRIGIGTWLPQDPKTVSTDSTLVFTESGIERLSNILSDADMQDGFAALDFISAAGQEDERIKGIYDHGYLPMFKADVGGVVIECTSKHKFKTLNSDGSMSWRALKDIDDRIPVLIKTGMSKFGKAGKPLSDFNDKLMQLNPGIAEIVGGLVAEGSCTGDSCTYCNIDDFLLRRFDHLLKTEFGVEPRPTYAVSDEADGSDVLVKTRKQVGWSCGILLKRWLDYNFTVSIGACEKRVPDVILGASRECHIEFLEGLFLGDGSIYFKKDKVARFSYATCSIRLAMDVQSMLLNLGFFTRLQTYVDKKYTTNTQYSLVSEGYDVYEIADMFPRFASHREFDVLKPSTHACRYENFGDLSDLIREIRKYTTGTRDIIDRRYCLKTANKRSPSRRSLEKWIDELEEVKWTDPTKKIEILSRIKDFLSFKCVTVRHTQYVGMKHGVDLSCDSDTFSYVANGLVSHNSQDQSELVGGIDYARIQEVGNEGDPRAYNLNGELEVANRGVMEFIEGLKADERFLRVLLTATQEKMIKAPRFGLISIDTFIIMHTNEEEFKNFMAERKYEAYHDRMVIVRVPYNLGVKNEVKIYEKLLRDSDLRIKSGDDSSGMSVRVGAEAKSLHIAPHTLEASAMFAVLTRLEPPNDSDLTLVTKMKLYDGQNVKGHKPSCVHDMYKDAPKEGMFGISPRFVIDQINASIANSAESGKNYITALDVLRQLLSGVQHRDSFSKEEKARFEQFIDGSRNEWNDLLRNDIQKAFFLSFEEEAKNLCDNYLTQIEMSLSDEKQRDPITDKEIELDEKLMESIEGHLEVSRSGVDDFRNEILHFFGTAARKGKKVDYTQHAQLREAIQKQLFEERQGTIRMTVSSRNPDPEGLRRLNDVVDRMVEQQGYTAGSANELLKYATAHLFDK